MSIVLCIDHNIVDIRHSIVIYSIAICIVIVYHSTIVLNHSIVIHSIDYSIDHSIVIVLAIV